MKHPGLVTAVTCIAATLFATLPTQAETDADFQAFCRVNFSNSAYQRRDQPWGTEHYCTQGGTLQGVDLARACELTTGRREFRVSGSRVLCAQASDPAFTRGTPGGSADLVGYCAEKFPNSSYEKVPLNSGVQHVCRRPAASGGFSRQVIDLADLCQSQFQTADYMVSGDQVMCAPQAGRQASGRRATVNSGSGGTSSSGNSPPAPPAPGGSSQPSSTSDQNGTDKSGSGKNPAAGKPEPLEAAVIYDACQIARQSSQQADAADRSLQTSLKSTADYPGRAEFIAYLREDLADRRARQTYWQGVCADGSNLAAEGDVLPIPGRDVYDGLWEVTQGPIAGAKVVFTWDGARLSGRIAELPSDPAAIASRDYSLATGDLLFAGTETENGVQLRSRLSIAATARTVKASCRQVAEEYIDDPWGRWSPINHMGADKVLRTGLQLTRRDDRLRLSGLYWGIRFPDLANNAGCLLNALKENPPLVQGGYMALELTRAVEECSEKPRDAPPLGLVSLAREKRSSARARAAIQLEGAR